MNINKKRKICVLTGKRGGLGALIPAMQLIEKDPNLELSVIATDMHLSDKFGRTITELEQWVNKAIRVPMGQEDDSPVSRAKALSKCMDGISNVLDSLKPDIFLVLGDRGEVLTAVIIALHLGIPVAHIQGGDISGNIDEMMRHAITKMSHIHFASTEESAERIRKMGEEDRRIYVVGDPHIDMIVQKRYTKGKDVRRLYNIKPEEPFILILVHPETIDPKHSYKNMLTTLKEIAKYKLRTLVVYPCSDHGHQGILDVIDKYSGHKGFSVHKNIEAVNFWGLMSEASLLIGNSSAGLIESPYFNLPVINIGNRQAGRQRWINVIDCPFNSSTIKKAMDKAFSPEFRKSFKNRKDKPFGDGKACKKIVEVLRTVKLDKRLIEKRMTY
jgi:UDP-N-acetylglucosamine 2-epimerase (non-hydrolysing)/GDP/UDP-N,N'-diacetylbacillosamine 2-epimerase (hydrolysing)